MNEMTKTRKTQPKTAKTRNFGISVETKDECSCCGKKWHDLEKYFKYISLDKKSKPDFIFQSRLCFRCLQPSSRDHIAKSCKKPRTCDTCKGHHPTSLHSEEIPVTSAFINSSNAIGLGVVEIDIRHQSDSTKTVKTLALLDMGSKGTFIRDDILGKLGIKGTETCLEVHTITGKTYQSCRSITGLKVSPSSDQTSTVSLPKVYRKSMIPVDSNDDPTPSKLKK